MSYLLIVYHKDCNAILVDPMRNRSSPEHKHAYQNIHEDLIKRGFKPQLQPLNNEASELLCSYLAAEKVEYQLAPPGIHFPNTDKRNIRMSQNNFIAGLCGTDIELFLQLWDCLLPQALMTFKLLRALHVDQHLSTYSQLHGAFDFNPTPLAPPGTRFVVHENPDASKPWYPHGVDGWYQGPSPENYR